MELLPMNYKPLKLLYVYFFLNLAIEKGNLHIHLVKLPSKN